MTAEQMWLDEKYDFMQKAVQSTENEELLEQYRTLLERIKTGLMASCQREDVLRQQIALLFAELSDGAGLLLSRMRPTIRRRETALAAKAAGLLTLLGKSVVQYAVLGAGFVLSFFAGADTWRMAALFAAAVALRALADRGGERKEAPLTVVSELRTESLEAMITTQMRHIDANVTDLRALIDDLRAPVADVALDADALALCQYVWGTVNARYPAENALATAEKLLGRHDVGMIGFTEDKRPCFDVMPTQRDARTIYPALVRESDGVLVRKGQYVENRQAKGAAK